MGYLHITNLYKEKDIMLFKKCYALEKIHGTSAHIRWCPEKGIGFNSGGEKHEKFLKLFDEELLTSKFEELFVDKVVIYGEAYGGKCQGMSETYGKELKFVAFDVKIGDNWLDVVNAEDVVNKLNLEFIDYKLINTTLKNIDSERDKFSTQAIRNGCGKDKKREGIVLRPLIELTKNNGSRVIAKHKGDDFRETKTPRVVSDEELKVLKEAEKIADEWVTAERLNHVLDKIEGENDITQTGLVIKNMVEDIYREAKGEIIESGKVKTFISRKTAIMFKSLIKKEFVSSQGGEQK